MQKNRVEAKSESSAYTKWRGVMKAYDASGLSQGEYCQRHGYLLRHVDPVF